MATMTFSDAVMSPNSRMFWKVRPIPRAAIECGACPVMSSSPSITCPEDGLYRPVRTLKKVVFPAPLGPMRETIPPSGIVKSTSRTAIRPPKRTVIFSARRALVVERAA